MVRSRSNGYDPTVAAHPAKAPLMKDRYGLKWMWSSARQTGQTLRSVKDKDGSDNVKKEL